MKSRVTQCFAASLLGLVLLTAGCVAGTDPIRSDATVQGTGTSTEEEKDKTSTESESGSEIASEAAVLARVGADRPAR